MKLLTLTLVGAVTGAVAASATAAEVLALRAPKLYTGTDVIHDAVVIVRDGKIAAAGSGLSIPEGARVFRGAAITPGLVDAHSSAGMLSPRSWAEQGSEVIPHLRTLDAADLHHDDFRRLARDGVTTVFLAADPASVVASRGAVVKTAGTQERRVLIGAREPMITISSESWRRGTSNSIPFGRVTYRNRRPTTGMGNVWVIRDSFYDAAHAARDGTFEDAGQRELARILRGESPVRILARRIEQIETAFRLTTEFGIETFTLVEGTEAYRIAEPLARAGIPVIYGPISERPRGVFRPVSGEMDLPALESPRILHEAGVTLALTAGDLSGEESLPRQAGFALRFGLPRGAAVTATTATPARLIGVGDRVGTVAPGRDADLVVWSGEPFDATSAARVVIIDGSVVHFEEETP